jgi:hypothetical protein
VIEHALAHKLKDAAEAAYQRGTLLVKRAMLMEQWAEFCNDLSPQLPRPPSRRFMYRGRVSCQPGHLLKQCKAPTGDRKLPVKQTIDSYGSRPRLCVNFFPVDGDNVLVQSSSCSSGECEM